MVVAGISAMVNVSVHTAARVRAIETATLIASSMVDLDVGESFSCLSRAAPINAPTMSKGPSSQNSARPCWCACLACPPVPRSFRTASRPQPRARVSFAFRSSLL